MIERCGVINMKVETMRREICKAYPNDIWHKRVKKMPDNQIIAIYHKFQQSGKFEKKEKPTYKQLKFDI